MYKKIKFDRIFFVYLCCICVVFLQVSHSFCRATMCTVCILHRFSEVSWDGTEINIFFHICICKTMKKKRVWWNICIGKEWLCYVCNLLFSRNCHNKHNFTGTGRVLHFTQRKAILGKCSPVVH